jgi:hypothetical protein
MIKPLTETAAPPISTGVPEEISTVSTLAAQQEVKTWARQSVPERGKPTRPAEKTPPSSPCQTAGFKASTALHFHATGQIKQ